MASATDTWQFEGDYFENCNCDVVCPCLFSPLPPFASEPTAGACEVGFGFHIDRGQFGSTRLDGLNAALAVRTPGRMGEGNWSVAVYVDERADADQNAALQQIFTGQVGGPIGALGPLISTVLGVKTVPITFGKEGKRRSIEIPGSMHFAVHAAPSLNPEREIWAANAHPFAEQVAMAVGDDGSGWEDYGMRWDNAGKNGHYAPIRWSGSR